MMDDKLEFRAYMKAAGSHIDQNFGGCPSETELADYHRALLNEDRSEHVQRHLIHCEGCRQRLVDLADFLDPLPANRNLDKEWRAFQKRLGPEKSGFFRFLTMGWRPMGAALAFASLVGAGIFVLTKQHYEARESTLLAQLRDKEAGPDAPGLNAALVDLLPRDAITRSERLEQTARVSAQGRPVILILNAAGQPDRAEYSVEILTKQGRSVWSGAGLTRMQGNYVVALPPGFLGRGDYTVRVSADGARIADYAFAVD
jgi:hypothetical protein